MKPSQWIQVGCRQCRAWVYSQKPWLWRRRKGTQLFISRMVKIPQIPGWWRWDRYFLPLAIIWNAPNVLQLNNVRELYFGTSGPGRCWQVVPDWGYPEGSAGTGQSLEPKSVLLLSLPWSCLGPCSRSASSWQHCLLHLRARHTVGHPSRRDTAALLPHPTQY